MSNSMVAKAALKASMRAGVYKNNKRILSWFDGVQLVTDGVQGRGELFYIDSRQITQVVYPNGVIIEIKFVISSSKGAFTATTNRGDRSFRKV